MSYDILATFYDSFIDPDVYERYLSLVDKYTSKGSLLDVGCGTGNLSIEFARRGFDVMATDLSMDMLQIVHYRAEQEEVDLELGIYDMLDPIPVEYDTIVASMDVINHLTDLEDVMFGFTNIFQSLKTNGVFIFDVLSPEYVDALDGYVEDDDEYNFHWESHKGDKPHSIIHTIDVDVQGEIERVVIQEETHESGEYRRIIKSVGFVILEEVALPERTIFVCQKQEKTQAIK